MIKFKKTILSKTAVLLVLTTLLASTLFAQFVLADGGNGIGSKGVAVKAQGTAAAVNQAMQTSVATDAVINPTPSRDTVKVGQEFTATLSIHNVQNIFAEDIKIAYDTVKFEYLGAKEREGMAVLTASMATEGVIQVISASLGTENAVFTEKNLFDLKFRAKTPGEGKIDVIAGRIADNISLELDVPSYACGDATVGIWVTTDVNRSGATTLLDLGIDAGYYGLREDQTDKSKHDADVVPNGFIDKADLSAIANDLKDNPDYKNYE